MNQRNLCKDMNVGNDLLGGYRARKRPGYQPPRSLVIATAIAIAAGIATCVLGLAYRGSPTAVHQVVVVVVFTASVISYAVMLWTLLSRSFKDLPVMWRDSAKFELAYERKHAQEADDLVLRLSSIGTVALKNLARDRRNAASFAQGASQTCFTIATVGVPYLWHWFTSPNPALIPALSFSSKDVAGYLLLVGTFISVLAVKRRIDAGAYLSEAQLCDRAHDMAEAIEAELKLERIVRRALLHHPRRLAYPLTHGSDQR
jgi:hypothetical protein